MLPFAMTLHFLVDALCCTTMLGPVKNSSPEGVFVLVMAYNAMAFATQFLMGLLADWLKRDRLLQWCALVSVFAGGLLACQPWLACILLGLGNSLFHVSAGREVIRRHAIRGKGRARELGLFVAPGALGIGLGCLFPNQLHSVILVAFAVVSLLLAWNKPAMTPEASASPESSGGTGIRLVAACLMTFCVLCRSASYVAFPGTPGITQALLLSFLIVAGKMTGGILGDRLDCWRIGICALLFSWCLFAFWGGNPAGVMLGQFIANLMMAVTLFVLVRLYPASPGLMFGLAASVLFPGSLIQYLECRTKFFSIIYFLAFLSFCSCWLLVQKYLRGQQCC